MLFFAIYKSFPSDKADTVLLFKKFFPLCTGNFSSISITFKTESWCNMIIDRITHMKIIYAFIHATVKFNFHRTRKLIRLIFCLYASNDKSIASCPSWIILIKPQTTFCYFISNYWQGYYERWRNVVILSLRNTHKWALGKWRA